MAGPRSAGVVGSPASLTRMPATGPGVHRVMVFGISNASRFYEREDRKRGNGRQCSGHNWRTPHQSRKRSSSVTSGTRGVEHAADGYPAGATRAGVGPAETDCPRRTPAVAEVPWSATAREKPCHARRRETGARVPPLLPEVVPQVRRMAFLPRPHRRAGSGTHGLPRSEFSTPESVGDDPIDCPLGAGAGLDDVGVEGDAVRARPLSCAFQGRRS